MNLVVDYTCSDHLCCTSVLRALSGWSSSWVKCSVPAQCGIWLSSKELREAKRLINYRRCVKRCSFLYLSPYPVFCHIGFLCFVKAKMTLFSLIGCTQRWVLCPQKRGNFYFYSLFCIVDKILAAVTSYFGALCSFFKGLLHYWGKKGDNGDKGGDAVWLWVGGYIFQLSDSVIDRMKEPSSPSGRPQSQHRSASGAGMPAFSFF